MTDRDQFTLAMFALFVVSVVCAKYTDRGHEAACQEARP